MNEKQDSSNPDPSPSAVKPINDQVRHAGVEVAGPVPHGEWPSRGNGIKALAVLTLMVGMLSVLGIVSFALFTDSETVAGNTFSSGGIDLTVSPGSSLVTLTAPAMAPGDQYTAPLTVGNAGTLELRYSMTSTTTEDVLAGELVMTIKSGVTTCDNANWGSTGTAVYSGVLGTVATTNVFGSSTQGADTGDRTIAGGTDEVLCFNVTLPLTATNASQGLTSTATFAFDAEQTDNNA
jgi:predicted ribosomally synthesized peptide with SipW-like signal peptide